MAEIKHSSKGNPMRILPVVAIILGLALPAMAQKPSVSGEYKFHLDVSGNAGDDTCTLTQTGDDLAGKCKTFTNVAGKVDGTKIVLKMQGQAAIELTGTIQEDKTIKGSVAVPEHGMTGEFVATPSK
jgi:hypothetical protein